MKKILLIGFIFSVLISNAQDTLLLSIEKLNKTLTINFENNFPFTITSWEETIDGLTTKATKLKTINTAYWSQNSNKDLPLRKTLQLD